MTTNKATIERNESGAKLKHEFDFSKVNSYHIYAPNGTMKTSFAKTFDLISKNDYEEPQCSNSEKDHKTL